MPTIGLDDIKKVIIGVKNATEIDRQEFNPRHSLFILIERSQTKRKEKIMIDKERRTGSYDDLPMSLNADDISAVLNISIGNAYNLLHREDFPTIHIGKRMVVPRDRFFAWIEKQYTDRGLVI